MGASPSLSKNSVWCSDDDSVSTVGAGSVHSAEGNAPNIRLPIVTKHSLDDTDLPHSVSEPVSPPGRYHGRQRSRSLVMSPRRPPMAVLEPGLTLAGLTHSDRPRLEKQESGTVNHLLVACCAALLS